MAKAIKVLTGNKNKQVEIKQVLNDKKVEFIETDLKEVIGNNVTIILHKAKDAKNIVKEDVMVEDVTMVVNNEFVPDIKWKQDDLKENDRVQLILTVAKTNGDKIEVFEKRLNGVIHLDKCNKYDFGFDNVFFVKDEICLGDFKQKKPFRKIYDDILKFDVKPDYVFDIKSIPAYKGKYQNQ